MPYKDQQKAKESARRRYLLNIEKRKLCGKLFYEKNKEKVKQQHRAKCEELKLECKKWRDQNKDKIKNYKEQTKDKRIVQQKKDRKKAIDKLSNWYVCNNIKARTGLSLKTIREHPELIDSFKEQIKLKRLLKQKKHGK